MQYFGFDRPSFALKTFGFGADPDDAILAIFAGGKQGVWYDPSDLSTLFQDVAGTIPVVNDGDPVALMRDKSGNGNHATQTVSTSRPVYKTDGVLHWLYFDGVDDYLSVSYSSYITQPAILAIAVQLIALTATKVLVSGVSLSNRHQITADLTGSAGFTVAAGGSSSAKIPANMLDKNIIIAKLNATSSNLSINNVSSAISLDTSGTNGFILGGVYVGGFYSNMRFYGGVHVSSAADTSELKQYLAAKAGVTL